MFKSVYRKPELAGWKGNFESQTGFFGDRAYAEYHHPHPHPRQYNTVCLLILPIGVSESIYVYKKNRKNIKICRKLMM